jgi:hypothetical protein
MTTSTGSSASAALTGRHLDAPGDGVFNRPVGAGYLTGLGDRQQLSALGRLRTGFVTAATPAARERGRAGTGLSAGNDTDLYNATTDPGAACPIETMT